MNKFIKVLKTIMILFSILLPVVGEAIHTIKPKIKEIWEK